MRRRYYPNGTHAAADLRPSLNRPTLLSVQNTSDIPCSCGGGPGNCLGQPAGDAAQAAKATTPIVPAIPLSQLRVGQCGIIQEKRLDEDDRSMLKAMGLACNSAVTLCRQGEPCIVAITTGGREGGRLGASASGCRIGLTRELSQRIFVTLNTPASSGAASRASTGQSTPGGGH